MSKPNSTPLTSERLRELLHYDSDTGVFTRLISCGVKRANAGDVAGSLHPSGYSVIKIEGKRYRAHRLAWLYAHGRWPKNQIDHIDCDRSNNRIANLRECTASENCQNLRKARRTNKTGLLGVSWDRFNLTFKASIKAGGKNHRLGAFLTAELAHAAYLSAKKTLHPFSTI